MIFEKNSILEVLNRIRYSIFIGKLRIYYGEFININIIIVIIEKNKELDYFSGEVNFYNIYDGIGGIVIGKGW